MKSWMAIAVVAVGASLGGCGVSSLNDVEPSAPTLVSGIGADAESASAKGPAVVKKTAVAPTAPTTDAGVVEASFSDTGPATQTGSIPRSDTSTRAAVDKLTSSARPGSTAYKIGPYDVLDVSVFKVAELSKTVQVSDAGTVNLPLVGEMQAGGRTSREVEKELTQKLGAKYLQNPQVTVFVKEYNSQRVTLEGAVKKPGVFPIQGRLTLLQAIATAQGLDDHSDSTVVIFRQQDGKRTAAHFDVANIRNGSESDPDLKAGDVVVAGKSALKETFGTILKAVPLATVFALI